MTKVGCDTCGQASRPREETEATRPPKEGLQKRRAMFRSKESGALCLHCEAGLCVYTVCICMPCKHVHPGTWWIWGCLLFVFSKQWSSYSLILQSLNLV